MLLVLFIELLLWSLWSTKTTAIFSLTASPPVTVESLNVTETEDPKQAFTVPFDLDLETSETDPVTDGGTEFSSQTAITSTVTPALDNVTGGVKNNIKLQELSTASTDPWQPISLDAFNVKITESPLPAVDSAPKDTGNNITLIPLPDTNKAYPFDEQPGSFLETPMENHTEEKQCFCNIPGPAGEKGDNGDKGDPGEPGPQGLEGAKGEHGSKGVAGNKGDKGDIGPAGMKGEPGLNAYFEKGDKGDKGIPGNDGTRGIQGDKGEAGEKGMKGEIGLKGDPGEKGSKGTDGIPGTPGEAGIIGPMGQRGPVGTKGDQGPTGAMGPQGLRGPAGIPGRKGEKGQKGSKAEHDNIAFSVAVKGSRNMLFPGQPMRFDRVFVNENKAYDVHTGVFLATIEGVYFFSYHLSPPYSSLVVGLVHNGKVAAQTRSSQPGSNSGSLLLHLHEDDEVWLQVISGVQNEFISDETDSTFTGFILYSLED